jgi:hypothetical protein
MYKACADSGTAGRPLSNETFRHRALMLDIDQQR